MRTYACTRETFPKKFSLHVFPHFLFFLLLLCLFLFPPSPSLSLLVFCASTTRKSVFCYVRIADLSLSKEENAHFLDFFTLWGNIDPYTNRGRTKEAHPILQISFTAEANLIYISLDFNNKRILLLIAPPNERWRAEAPATKLRCLR